MTKGTNETLILLTPMSLQYVPGNITCEMIQHSVLTSPFIFASLENIPRINYLYDLGIFSEEKKNKNISRL